MDSKPIGNYIYGSMLSHSWCQEAAKSYKKIAIYKMLYLMFLKCVYIKFSLMGFKNYVHNIFIDKFWICSNFSKGYT